MAYDLTLTGASFASAGAFGQKLTAGYGMANPWAGVGSLVTIDAKVNTTANGVLMVAVGSSNTFWMGMQNTNKAEANVGSGTTLATTVTINDGVDHYLRLCIDDTNNLAYFFVDGILAASSSSVFSLAKDKNIGVGTFAMPSAGFGWSGGSVDEVAVYSVVKSTTNYSVPTAPIDNAEAGLVALWHLDGNGVDSAGLSSGATAITMTGPSSGTNGTASTNFTIGANGAITGTVVVTPSDGGGGGTFTPTTVSISAGAPTATFTYTPTSTGAKTVSVTNNGALSNPSSITYTSGATVPGAPTIGTATAGNASASVTFTAPASNGGATITGYTVTSSPGGFTGTGASSPINVSGLTNGTAYTFTVTATNSAGTGSASAASNSVTPSATNVYNQSNILFSPYNWNVQATYAAAVNVGAYAKFNFGGTSCALAFDVSTLAGVFPQVEYRVDGGPWNVVTVAASVSVTMNSATTAYANHLLELVVKGSSESSNRWNGTSNIVKLTGITLDASKTISKPSALPLYGLYYGDSITEGSITIAASGDATVKEDGVMGWAYESGRLLGAEFGVVGFGGQGIVATGAGSVPAITSTYGSIYSGVARSFSPMPDYICVNIGTNDGTSNTTTAMTTLLNGLLSATTTTKIVVLRPFNGTSQAANIQAAIAACSAPSRCAYVDTAGWFSTANSFDSLHPNGFENLSNLAPRVANAIRPIVSPQRGQRTQRTVSVSLVDGSNSPQSSLTGLKWAFYDQALPSLTTVAADQGVSETTDGSGVLTIPVYTTLAPGATGWLTVTDSDGTTSMLHKAFSGPVVVS